ncbi:hypothetical protein T484DRAFT_1940208, partial [Baffinella frigidus]
MSVWKGRWLSLVVVVSVGSADRRVGLGTPTTAVSSSQPRQENPAVGPGNGERCMLWACGRIIRGLLFYFWVCGGARGVKRTC